ncbi:MAG: zf-HC2 domain-containing protein [Eubacterium sp.]|nr:zf-HC2 domain-containing protein [Eubacterium sp.]
MDCRKTQSLMQAFIDYRLDDDETVDFIDHIRACPKCSEELEIYYTMLNGLRQLENGSVLTADFTSELAEDMRDRYDQIKVEKKRENYTRLTVYLILIIFAVSVLAYIVYSTMTAYML